MNSAKVIQALRTAWEREIEAAQLYRALGEAQKDLKKQRIFIRLAESEESHANQFSARIRELGGVVPEAETNPTAAQRLLFKTLGTDAMLRRMEADEEKNIALFERNASDLASDPESHELFNRIEEEEKRHAVALHSLKSQDEPRTRLEAMLKGEKWHNSTGSWIGDAIYGVNDGLGAVFGVVSGMAGATGASAASGGLSGDSVVRVAGLVAMLASALSMGASAFMASKSEREVYDAEIERERSEIENSPEHETEELSLLYQLKGFSEEEADKVAERISSQPELFLKTMAQEELGLTERSFPNPLIGAFSAALSTAVGGIVPIIPFFFLRGIPAVIASAAVGMIAHFVVGAAKSLITARSWWASGLEMTVIGIITGGVTFGLGKLFQIG